jgi:hypothetical protein
MKRLLMLLTVGLIGLPLSSTSLPQTSGTETKTETKTEKKTTKKKGDKHHHSKTKVKKEETKETK